MKQYEYQLTRKATGRIEWARATAASPDIARAQIVLMYGSQFDVAELYSGINPPHRILGEIDCSDFPMSDFAWLMREAKRSELLLAA
jgi:hypothetical protein